MDFFVALTLLMQTPAPEVSSPSQDEVRTEDARRAALQSGEATEQAPIDQVLICRERRRTGTLVAHTECYSRNTANRRADIARESVRLMLENSGHNNR